MTRRAFRGPVLGHLPQNHRCLWKAALGLVFALLGGVIGCSPEDARPVPEGDSHTNWLRTCSADAQCESLQCICGMCTQGCRADGDCADGSACFTSSSAAVSSTCTADAPVGLCLPRCEPSGCGAGFACNAGACLPLAGSSVRVQVDTQAPLQALVGFGATLGYAEDELATLPERTELDAALFAGLGLDVLRFRNRYAEVSNARLSQATALVSAAERSLGHRPLVLLSSWSPPPSLKQNGATFCSNGPATCTLALNAAGGFDYAGLARHWRETLLAYAGAGFTPDFIGIQNNPDWAPASGLTAEACKLLPFEGTEDVLVDGTSKPIRYPGYGEAVAAITEALADLPQRPQLLAPELAGLRGADRYFQTLDASSVDAIAHHMYGSVASRPDTIALKALDELGRGTTLPLFQTEMQAGGFDTAVLIHQALVDEGAAMYLQTALVAPRTGPAANPFALVGLESGQFVLQDPYFAMQHFALFTDPGYRRLPTQVTDASILASAWRAPQGTAVTLVLINTGSKERVIDLNLGDMGPVRLWRSNFESGERMASLGQLPSPAEVTLPARSVVTARWE